MKSGLTIVEMAQQIERQSKLKQDYLLDTRRLQVEPFGSQLYLHTFDDHDDPLVEPLEINQIAHRQIGTHLKIPAAYYDRMLSDYPELLAENVNSWFQREPTQRMVRTLDGTVRAFLSNRYRRIDNLDIAEIVLPVIQQMEDAYFESCQITDSRMYIKVVNKRLEAEVVPGDIVQSGVNSSCIFLTDGRCSVYPARTRTCRIYPLTVGPGERGRDFEYCLCLDRHQSHFTGSRVSVKDWLYQNFKREDKEYVKREYEIATELGKLMRAIDPAMRPGIVFKVLYYRYYNFDLGQPFQPQYEQNNRHLLADLHRIVREQ